MFRDLLVFIGLQDPEMNSGRQRWSRTEVFILYRRVNNRGNHQINMYKILIVDDIKQNLDILEAHLLPLEYEVLRAENGLVALELLEQHSDTSLVILDIMMPVKNGFDTCTEIRNNPKTENIPVIFITAMPTPGTRLRCIECGGDDFLEKPVDNVVLEARTKSLIKRKEVQDELAYSYEHLTDIVNQTEESISKYDPLHFDYNASNDKLLQKILRNRSDKSSKRPEYALLAYKNEGYLSGHLFYKENGDLLKFPEQIDIDIKSSEAITLSINSCDLEEVCTHHTVFSNWFDSEGTLAKFQLLFNPAVIDRVGVVKNYVTYYSGQLAVIMFNYGKKVNEFDAQILKGFTAHANFLRTISEQAAEISQKKELEHSYENITDIINVTEANLVAFDPLTFDYGLANENLLTNILKNVGEKEDRKPEFVLLAIKSENTLLGELFFKENDHLKKTPEKISIDLSSSAAITLSAKNSATGSIVNGSGEMVFSNWYENSSNIYEYQSHFNSKVITHVGEVRNFVTYYSGQLAVIAFNYGKDVNEFDAQILKGFLINSSFLKTISEQAKMTEDAFLYSVGALARASEANDEDTFSHIIRVNKYSEAIAIALGCPTSFTKSISIYAQMHDVGKIHVSRDILRKPAKLTDEEYTIMKEHTVYGAKILGDESRLAIAREIAISHHEKYDGSGYPYGLTGEEIPLSGRIVTIADIYDALRSKRHYKPAFPHEQVYKIITEGDGRTMPKDFDPKILDVFKREHKMFEDIFATIQDDTIEHA